MAQRIVGGEPHVNYDKVAKEVLVDAHEELITDLHSSTALLEDLVNDNILTQAEYDATEAQETDFVKNDKLLTAMRRKSGEQIGRFCQFLIAHGQQPIGGILKSSMLLLKKCSLTSL